MILSELVKLYVAAHNNEKQNGSDYTMGYCLAVYECMSKLGFPQHVINDEIKKQQQKEKEESEVTT